MLLCSMRFGIAYGTVILLMWLIPVLIALGIRRQWNELAFRDVGFLAVLVVAMIAANCISVWYWYETGLDQIYQAQLESSRIARTLVLDPAFHEIKMYVSPRSIYWLKGTVETPADLEHLKRLASECRYIEWNYDILTKPQIAPVEQ